MEWFFVYVVFLWFGECWISVGISVGLCDLSLMACVFCGTGQPQRRKGGWAKGPTCKEEAPGQAGSKQQAQDTVHGARGRGRGLRSISIR
jgi:hypothetical protein